MNDQATKTTRAEIMAKVAASEELVEIVCRAVDARNQIIEIADQQILQLANLARQANMTLAGVNYEQQKLF